VTFDGLAKSFRSSPHHSSAIYFKRNLLVSLFKPHPLLSRETFSALALDYLTFGNCFLERRYSMTSKLLPLTHSLAKYTRRGQDLNTYSSCAAGPRNMPSSRGMCGTCERLTSIRRSMACPSTERAAVGLAERVGHAVPAPLLQQRQPRRLHPVRERPGPEPGRHRRDAPGAEGRQGPGNFRNLFLYSPHGKKDGIQLIPVSEVAAKDEFFSIKGITRDDVLAAHRIPPQLLGIVPPSGSAFGDVGKAADTFVANEIAPCSCSSPASTTGWASR
jgi:hypothetical protein